MIGFPIALPVDSGVKRRWIVGEECGDVFQEGDEFDGITVTIELHSAAEARAVTAALLGQPVAMSLPQDQPRRRTNEDANRLVSHIHEALIEISRINRAAGETVFNPAARQALETVLEELSEDQRAVAA